MDDLLNGFLLVFAGLFPIVDPVGGAPIFLAWTDQLPPQARHKLALKVAANSFWLLLGALFVGSHVLEFFGITLPVVRIAGGLVVSAFGWKLLNSPDSTAEKTDSDRGRSSTTIDAFYPLTMPLTVGPGSISVAITLGSQRPKAEPLLQFALLGGSAIAGLLALAATIYVCYRFAERITAALGQGGTNVLIRLSAFILLCIGIQIIWNGYTALTVAP